MRNYFAVGIKLAKVFFLLIRLNCSRNFLVNSKFEVEIESNRRKSSQDEPAFTYPTIAVDVVKSIVLSTTRFVLVHMTQIIELQRILVSLPQKRCQPVKRQFGHERCARMFITDFLVRFHCRFNGSICGDQLMRENEMKIKRRHRHYRYSSIWIDQCREPTASWMEFIRHFDQRTKFIFVKTISRFLLFNADGAIFKCFGIRNHHVWEKAEIHSTKCISNDLIEFKHQ